MKLLMSLSATGNVLYHKTHSSNVLNMLKTGKIELTSAMAATADANINHGYQYYLSTARTLTGKYNYMSSGSVQLVLDRDKLKNNYRIEAVDYWGEAYRKHSGGKYEQEDRILSNKPNIPLKGIVKEAHLIQEGGITKFNDSMAMVAKLKRLGVKVYVYTNTQDAQILNRKRAIPIDSSNFKVTEKRNRFPDYSSSFNTPKDYMELLQRPAKYESSLSDSASKLKASLRYQSDFMNAMSGQIRNSKRNAESQDATMKRFLVEAAKLRLTTLKAIHEYLADKWGYRYY